MSVAALPPLVNNRTAYMNAIAPGLDEYEELAMYDRAAATWAQLIWDMPCVEQ